MPGGASSPDFARIFDEAPAPLLLLTPDLVIVHANRARLDATSTTLADTVGRDLFDAFPLNPDDPAADGTRNLAASLSRVLATRRPETMPIQQYDIPMPDGTFEERFWSPRNVPVLDDRGEVAYLLHQSDDITDYVLHRDTHGADRAATRADGDTGELRERIQQAEADLFRRTRELEALNAELLRANARERRTAGWLAGLAQSAAELAQAQTMDDLLTRVLRRCAPTVGAGHAAVALRRGGDLRVFSSSAVSGDDAVVEHHVALDSPSAAAAAARGEWVLVGAAPAPQACWPLVVEGTAAGPVPRALAAMPLRSGAELLGSLTLGWAENQTFDATEARLLDSFARQCARALERIASLQAERDRATAARTFAETFQRALLTDPPQLDHGQLVARYRPASHSAKIGGDWYDAFVQPDGATVLVIGDVTGHDVEAAATMGQLRSLLRGIAVTTGGGPAAVLSDLDRAMHALEIDILATAVVLRLERPVDGPEPGGTRIRWSNAGHPPPVLLDGGGTVRTLGEQENDVLLGVAPGTRRSQSEATLVPGATVLLYTDGLVERRDRGLDHGIDLLVATVRDVASSGVDLDTLCDEVLARMLPEHPGDDVALIAVRLHP